MGPDILDLLRRHVSVREYAPGDVPQEEWLQWIRAAQQASTDATGQLYSAIEVRDPDLRRRVAVLAGDQRHVHQAPRFLVVCLDVRRLRLLLEHRHERLGIRRGAALLFGITDAALFAQGLVVAAEAAGFGVCFVGGVQNHGPKLARELQLPEGVVPLWGLTFGRPAKPASPKPRVPTSSVLHVDQYHDLTDQELGDTFTVMAPATRSGDWVNPLRKYFAPAGVMDLREEDIWALLEQQGLGPGK